MGLLQILGQLIELLGRLFRIAPFFHRLSGLAELFGQLLHHLLLLLGPLIHLVELLLELRRFADVAFGQLLLNLFLQALAGERDS